MKVVKASGKEQAYSRAKFCRSLRRSGASKDVIDRVCRDVEKELKNGVTTESIFKKTERRLNKENPILAAKYSLRSGIMELGPAGFLFEQYIAAILREYGYKTQTNQIMKGHCVFHEIDVLAFKNDIHYIIEVKYHNSRGIKSGIKTAMYMQARLEDIAESKRDIKKHVAWLVTNTKFTSNAVNYSKCKNVRMTGWKYPKGEDGLEQLIEQKGLYPVTVIPAVNSFAREQFAKKNILFAKDLAKLSENYLIKRLDIRSGTAKKILIQAKELTL